MPCGPAAYLGGCCDGGGVIGQQWTQYAWNLLFCFPGPAGCNAFRTLNAAFSATISGTTYTWTTVETTESCPGAGDSIPITGTGAGPGVPLNYRMTSFTGNSAIGDILDGTLQIVGSWTNAFSGDVDVAGKVQRLIDFVNSQPIKTNIIHPDCPTNPDLPPPFLLPLPVYPYIAAARSGIPGYRAPGTSANYVTMVAARSQRIIGPPGASTNWEVDSCGVAPPANPITLYPVTGATLVDIKAPAWNSRIRFL